MQFNSHDNKVWERSFAIVRYYVLLSTAPLEPPYCNNNTKSKACEILVATQNYPLREQLNLCYQVHHETIHNDLKSKAREIVLHTQGSTLWCLFFLTATKKWYQADYSVLLILSVLWASPQKKDSLLAGANNSSIVVLLNLNLQGSTSSSVYFTTSKSNSNGVHNEVVVFAGNYSSHQLVWILQT